MIQRIIKFRGWHIFGKEMVYNFSDLWADDYKVMQFTGMLDKNDKKIYEGDILTTGHNNFECIFWKGSFVANLISSEKKKEQGYLALEILEVIGNIYENPELLKGVKE